MASYIIKKDARSEYYWVLRSDKNYKMVAMSSESYNSKQGAQESVVWNQKNGNTASVIDETGER